jgi:hypothetical protein
MPDFSLLIPHDDTGDERRNALVAWTSTYWRSRLPEAEVLVGGVGATPANRSANRNLLAGQATGDLLAFVDADCTTRIADMNQALTIAQESVGLVKFGRVEWLSRPATRRLIRTAASAPLVVGAGDVERFRDEPRGLAFIMRREVFEAAGGWDERFVAWGEEDTAFTLAAETLAGPLTWAPSTAYHLWHPRARHLGEHEYNSPSFVANHEHRLRYNAAAGDPEAMRELVAKCR